LTSCELGKLLGDLLKNSKLLTSC